MCVRLPQELWHLIVESGTWSRPEIRKLRLTSKEISQAATPLLFNSILLRPNIANLERAQRVASASHLAQHVRKIYLRPDAVAAFVRTVWEFIDIVDITYLPKHDKVALCDSANRFIEGYPAMVEKQEAYKEIDCFQAIAEVCQRLPNLSALDFSKDEDPTSEFSKMYGFEADYGDAFQVPDQLRLCEIVKPTSVLIPALEWACFLQRSGDDIFIDEKSFSGFQSVETLDMRVEFHNDAPEGTLEQFQSFKDCWGQAPNVKELTLGFNFYENLTPSASLLKLTSAMLVTTWSKLWKVELVNMKVRQADLHDFLRKHRKTLKHVCLHKVTFSDYLDEDLPDFGRIIKTLIFMKKTLSLRKFELKGYVGTPFADLFRAHPSDTQDTHLRRIQDFVCHSSAQFPFPVTAHEICLESPYLDLDIPLLQGSQQTDGDSTQDYLERHLRYEEAMAADCTDTSWRCCENNDVLGFSDESGSEDYETDESASTELSSGEENESEDQSQSTHLYESE